MQHFLNEVLRGGGSSGEANLLELCTEAKSFFGLHSLATGKGLVQKDSVVSKGMLLEGADGLSTIRASSSGMGI